MLVVCALCARITAQEVLLDLQNGIPIRVREDVGIPRILEPATFGVPIAEAEGLFDLKTLAVFDPEGKLVPSQFRVLERWRAAPSDESAPIKWLLIDLQMNVPASGEVAYTLRYAGSSKPEQKAKKKLKYPRLEGKKKGAKETVETGLSRFVIDTSTANFLGDLRFDLDKNGKLSTKESLIDPVDSLGFILTDRFGATYSSTSAPATVTLEETGKLRTVWRVDGVHAPTTEGGGIGRDFFRFTTRYTFHAGKPYVRIQHTLKNDYLTNPLGTIGFESYTLPIRLKPATGQQPATYRGSFGLGDGTAATQTGALSLYQDTDGGPKWNVSANAQFSGFRLTAGETELASGAQAAGYIDVNDGGRGLLLVMKDFFENYPKAFRYDGNGLLSFEIFPADYASFFWLDDEQQKTTEFMLYPHSVEEFDAELEAKRYNHPLRPFIDPTYMRTSKAWADFGDLDDPPQADATLIAFDVTKLTEMYNQAFQRTNYAFGWSDFGETYWAKSTHTTGSPRNKLTYFDRFAINGSLPAFRMNELFVLHSRDIRPYHIGGFSKDDHPNAILWEGVPHISSTDKLGRNTIPTSLAPHKQGIPSTGNGWNGFDIEHFVADDLYEYYLLTGDPVSYESLAQMGQAMRTWPIYVLYDPVGSTRGVGWAMRGLIRIWRVTGDPDILACADTLAAVAATTYNKDQPSPITGEVYHWLTRFPPNSSHIATAEYEVPWQLAVAIHGMLLHHHETGNETSKEVALDFADYIIEDCWDPTKLTVKESLANDDDSVFLPKPDNMGVNTWIPSALARCYRVDPQVEYLGVAQHMYDSVPTLQAWNSYYGFGIYHWWHSYRALILDGT